MGNENKVYQKYIISRTDGKPVDPEARYFVLRLDKKDDWGRACRKAVMELARNIYEQNPEFGQSLIELSENGDWK